MWQSTTLLVAAFAVASVYGKVNFWTSQVCANLPSGALARSPTSCHHYLYCANGAVGYELTCPTGLGFSAGRQACGPLGDADCPSYFDHITPDKVRPLPQAAARACAGAADRTFVASPTSCKHYYFCHNGIAEEGKCPIGHAFEANEQVCRDIRRTTCRAEADAFEKPVETETAVERIEDVVCKGVVDNIFVASPTSCGHYFLCANDTAKEDTCPEGYAFNDEEQMCDPKDEVYCLMCPRTGHYDIVDPKDCNNFYRCENGVRSLWKCGAGQIFDKNSRTCKPRREAQCDAAKLCHYRNETTNNFLFGDSGDCKKFYLCKDKSSTPIMSECSDDLVFNPKSSMCERKYFVEGCTDYVLLLEIAPEQDIEQNRRNARRILPPRRDERHPNAKPIWPTLAPPGQDSIWDFPNQPSRPAKNGWGPPIISGDGGGSFPSWNYPTTTTRQPRPPGGLPIHRPKPTTQPPPDADEPATWGPPRIPSGFGGGGGGPSFDKLSAGDGNNFFNGNNAPF